MQGPENRKCRRCGWQGEGSLYGRLCPECFSPLWVYQVGHRVGPYELEEILGTGAFAEVWLGVHSQFGYVRALKRIRLEDMLPSWEPENIHLFQQRFIQEARVQATLHHPHIIQVFDLGDWHGEIWMVMEYCGGGTLEDLLRGGRLEIRTALKIIRHLLEGLAFAHQNHVIHRDIKPSNLMKMKDSEIWKLGDFGIAKVLSDVQTTRTGVRMGTPHYMAPEQWDDPDHVGAPSDIYSVGCIFYRMIEGHLPFSGDSITEVMRKHLLERPPQMHHAPAWLMNIIFKALEKDPAKRYQNAEEMMGDLEVGLRHRHRSTERKALPDIVIRHLATDSLGTSLASVLLAGRKTAHAIGVIAETTLIIYHALTLERLKILEIFDRTIFGLEWFNEPDSLLICEEGKRLIIFDLVSLKPERRLPLPSEATVVAHHPQTRHVLTGHSDGRVILWDRRVWTPLFHHRIHTSSVIRVSIHPKGLYWASLSNDGVLNVGKIHPFQHKYTIRLEDEHPLDFDWHPLTSTLAVSTQAGNVLLIHGEKGRRLGLLKTRRTAIHTIRFHSQGEYLVGGTDDGELVIWRVVSGTIAQVIHAHEGPIMYLALTGSGSVILTAGLDFALRSWMMQVDYSIPAPNPSQ